MHYYRAFVTSSTALLELQQSQGSDLADLSTGFLPHECTAQKPTAAS